jgi:cytochrome c nitrite reductase small subunit
MILRGLGWLTLAFALLMGMAAGMGTYTFHYAQGASYFSNDAQVCANCHIMQSHYDAWLHSSHRSVAKCNDCHAPHEGQIAKLYCKGRNGFFHSLAFTTGDFPEPIQITPYNRRITENACRSCHGEMVHAVDQLAGHGLVEQLDCIRCHRDVGHPR